MLGRLPKATCKSCGLVVYRLELALRLEASRLHLSHLRHPSHIWLYELVGLESRWLRDHAWAVGHTRLLWLKHAHLLLLLLLLLHHQHHSLLVDLI